MCGEKCWVMLLGVAVCLISISTLALAIADVINTWMSCIKDNFTPLTSGLFLTWIAVGIWASIPNFITGVLALLVGKNLQQQSRKEWLAVLGVLSSLFFAPAIVVISAFEIFFKVKEKQRWRTTGLLKTSLSVIDPLYSLPFAVGVGGSILFLLVFILSVYACCRCFSNYGSQKNVGRSAHLQADILPTGAGYDEERVHVTTTHRWLTTGLPDTSNVKADNNDGSSYYASGAPPVRSYEVGAGSRYNADGPRNYQLPRPTMITASSVSDVREDNNPWWNGSNLSG